MPPYSSENGSPKRPIFPICETTSYGKLCSASCFAATGATTDCAKSRTVSIRSV
ncbi:Uncharacterised protein [Mycobacteroides abscessus subsp. abscessus]|nr:Uncharacterised protein [Mycobacteroides abscessus subsp. abscessus]